MSFYVNQDLVDVLQNMKLPKLANMILPSQVGLDYFPQATGQVHWHSPPSYQETVGFEKGSALSLPLGSGANRQFNKPIDTYSDQFLGFSPASCKRTPIEHESLPYPPQNLTEATNISEHPSLENFSIERNCEYIYVQSVIGVFQFPQPGN